VSDIQNTVIDIMLNRQAAEPSLLQPEPIHRMRLNVSSIRRGGKEVPISIVNKNMTAVGFMKLLRSARDRNEKIAAIQAYIGYDMQISFAQNEYAAQMAAQQELKPIKLGSIKYNYPAGVVAGVPNPVNKKLQDLRGREKLAAAAMTECELLAANLVEGSVQQKTALGMADVERERLIAIRADIKLL